MKEENVLRASPAGVLFVGDSLVSDQGILRGSRRANTWDRYDVNASVKVQAALGTQVVCAGHGPVIMDAAGKFPQM